MANREQYEYKIVLLGEAGVGKTSLFNRIKTGRFHDGQSTQGADRHTYTTTIGDDQVNANYQKNQEVFFISSSVAGHSNTVLARLGGDHNVPSEDLGGLFVVSLWDTGGGERFRTLTNNFYRNADGAMLVYCLEDNYTFENLQEWIDDASQHVNMDSFKWALIGNKCDLPNEVEKTRVEARCEQLQTKLFYSVSAKTGHNVMKSFNDLISAIHKKQHIRQQPHQTQRSDKVQVDSVGSGASTKQSKSGCC